VSVSGTVPAPYRLLCPGTFCKGCQETEQTKPQGAGDPARFGGMTVPAEPASNRAFIAGSAAPPKTSIRRLVHSFPVVEAWLKAMPFRISRARAPAPHGLEAMLPVSGLSFVMSDGYDAQYVGVIQVDDRKWKAVKHESSSSVQILGPAMGRLHKVADDSGYRYTKFRSDEWAPAAVPSDCVPEVFACLGVKPEALTPPQGNLWRASVALARRVSF
jgi:hypothetical protein